LDAVSLVVAAVTLLIVWACLIGIGLGVRRFLRRRLTPELLLWSYLMMGLATTLPQYLYRASLDTRFFPGANQPDVYLPWVVFDFVVLSLTWPFLEYLLLASPYVNPAVYPRVVVEALSAVVATCLLAPAITFALRRLDRRRKARQQPSNPC
jgi:hypothetical protein